MMVNSADGNCFFCCWGYLLLQVMVVEFEKKTCFAQPQGGEICLGSFQDC